MTAEEVRQTLMDNLGKLASVRRQPYPLKGIEVNVTGILHHDEDEDQFFITFDQGWYGTASVGFKVAHVDEAHYGVYYLNIDLK
jgi:hypothetical protein